MPKKMTHDEFIRRVGEKSQTIDILSTYSRSTDTVLCRCSVCGNEWSVSAHQVLNSGKCPKCSVAAGAMSRRMSHDEYVNKLHSVRDDIEVIGKYTTSQSKVRVRGVHCNHEWEAKANNLLNNKSGCPYCHGLNKNTQSFIDEVLRINQSIEVLGEYRSSKSPVLFRCKSCRLEWEATPNSILRGANCPVCSHKRGGEKIRKTHADFIRMVQDINPTVVVLGEYELGKKPVLCKCGICGNEWETMPVNITQKGSGCPKCKFSKGERTISEYLDLHNIEYISQKRFSDCKDIYALPFDFYIPSLNLCIEYDGGLHYRSVDYFGGDDYFEKVRRHDEIKTKYCESKPIKLLRISYLDFHNIESILDGALTIYKTEEVA